MVAEQTPTYFFIRKQDVFMKHKFPPRVANSIDSHAYAKAFEK
jgi:hypothetical protein